MQKFVLSLFVVILVVGLAVVFVPGDDSWLAEYGPAPNSGTVLAEVGDYEITVADLETQLRSMERQRSMLSQRPPRPQDEPDPISLYPTYGKQALESLVNARTVRIEADRLGLGATREEMRDRILEMFSPNGRWIGTEAYSRYVRDQGLTLEQFEQDVADQITEEKLRNFLTAGLTVSDREIEEDYRRTGTTMNPTYVIVQTKLDAAATLQPSDDELRAYFDANRDRFATGQRLGNIAYVFIDQAKVGETMQFTDEELRADYNPDSNVAAVRVAEIVFNIPSPQQDADIRAQAQSVADRARGKDGQTAEDFAEIARQSSENKATAANGGDAGFIEKASMRPGDPRDVLFGLRVDQISQPIRVGNSYVVYKVLERRSKSFEEVRSELAAAARQRRSYGRAVDIADAAEQSLKSTKDLTAAVQAANQAAGAEVASVRETGFFQPGDSIPGVGTNPQLDEIVRSGSKGDVGSKASVQNGLAIPTLADVREASDIRLEDVRGKVLAAWREQKARDDARAAAERLATGATSPDDLMAQGRAAGYDARSQANYLAGGTLTGLFASDLVDTALLGLATGQVSKTPLELPTGFLVLAQGERKEPDMGDAFNMQKEAIRERLLASRRAQLYATYMNNRVQQLKEAGEIVIYQRTIDRAFILSGDDEDVVPELPPAGAPNPSGRKNTGVQKPVLPPQTPTPISPPPATNKR